MTDDQRKRLLAKLEEDARRIETLTPEQARQRLIQEGIYGPDGELSPRYGGKEVASAG